MEKKHKTKYRTKLMGFVMLVILIVFFTGMYSYKSMQLLMKSTVNVFTQNQEVTQVYKEIKQLQNELELYLSTDSSEGLLTYYDYTNSINQSLGEIEKNVSFDDFGVKRKNLSNMVEHYLETTDETVSAKRERNIDKYIECYEKSISENKAIKLYIEELMSNDLIESSKQYDDINNKIESAKLINNILNIIVMIMVFVSIILFSKEITEPITKLTHFAKEVSRGNFKIKAKTIETSEEMNILYDTFNMMAQNVDEYFDEVNKKRELEAVLNEEKLNNLRMKSALHEAEFLALQSQINPHFIFNTINIGAQMSMLEGDLKTSKYLECAADVLRYNLRGLSDKAALREEIDNTISYMELLKTRFGEFIKFELEVELEEEELSYLVPRMTFQPLIENAFIHGISELEEGGTVGLRIYKDKLCVNAVIWDTGKGIDESTKKRILDAEAEGEKGNKEGHTTGIGVDNVLNRLRLFFNKTDVMDITRVDGVTSFILMLPL